MTLKSSLVIFQAFEPLQALRPLRPHRPLQPHWPDELVFVLLLFSPRKWCLKEPIVCRYCFRFFLSFWCFLLPRCCWKVRYLKTFWQSAVWERKKLVLYYEGSGSEVMHSLQIRAHLLIILALKTFFVKSILFFASCLLAELAEFFGVRIFLMVLWRISDNFLMIFWIYFFDNEFYPFF